MLKKIISHKYAKKIFLISAAALAVAVIILFRPGSDTEEASQKTFTKTFAAEIGSIKDSFTSNGYVELSTYDISFDRAGIISTVNVSEGDFIDSGTLIASLSSEDYESAVATQNNSLDQAKLSYQKNSQSRQQNIQSLENSLLSAKNNLENAQSEYDMVCSIEDAYSDIVIDQKRQALESCQLQYDIALDKYNAEKNSSVDEQIDILSIEKAEENLKNAQDDLQKSMIYSPVSGTIVDISKKEGERITEDDTFIRITSDNSLSIKTDVSEIDISKVSLGMPVQISFNSLGRKTYDGTVEFIDQIATASNNGTVTYEVSISISQTEEMVKDGMSCTVEFITSQLDNVLMVPRKALSRTSSGNQYAVTVVGAEGEENEKIVEVGLMTSMYAQITGGLSEGENVKVSVNLDSSGGKSAMRTAPGGGNGGH
ncbi:membrane fusion protein, macrolide-specific efflux system [Peptoclostridium litorale DSM 5388]|uniref:RND-like efflux transporter n=1 Tax=Peptoclostridium litorale DSM 5388 TaxID=1121324 RepID=A0A069RG30_PEPLI|nr:efflux RND transporter periplasmic adaptor subunit [Peptoclostridium litorale]KDR95768.1 RND-like efflux transporter [Peptoclostridium litorale DSM 5388]SIO21710.1 membrane fusion protein, macrolide-specific efflux system [Peptoclostridium litorale DSM 5388]